MFIVEVAQQDKRHEISVSTIDLRQLAQLFVVLNFLLYF